MEEIIYTQSVETAIEQFYANADLTGKIIAYYTDAVHTLEQIPLTAIQITTEQWQDSISNQGKYSVINGVFTADGNYGIIDPVTSLQNAKLTKIKELNGACNLTILSGFKSSALGTPHDYSFDDEAQKNLTGTKALLNDFPEGTIFPWKTYQGIFDHNKNQMTQVCMDSFFHVLSNTTKYRTLAAQVDGLETESEVNAIIWE